MVTSLKSILLSEFYNNFLIHSFYPLELSLLSFTNSFEDIILKWIFIGWFKLNIEIEYINNIQHYEDYIILISWAMTFVIYNIYIILKYRKKITKYIYISYMLKYLIINYFSIFLWSFNLLVNYDSINYFILILINVYVFNFITFWFPGILFNYIYGEKMYIYRKKYDFIIDNYNKKSKYFTLILQGIKSLSFIYIILYNYYSSNAYYFLIGLNLMNILIFIFSKEIFNSYKINIYLIILNCFSTLLIILSIVEHLYEYLFIVKYSLLFINFCLFIYFNYKFKKINNNENNQHNELSLNYIEMNIIRSEH